MNLKDIQVQNIQIQDSLAVKNIIETVMTEFNATGEGFAIVDPEVQNMFESYQKPDRFYLVAKFQDEVVGGVGVGPLEAASSHYCELKKMYFLPSVRSIGLGQRMLEQALDGARKLGYDYCYIETLTSMEKARKLYQRNGFEELKAPLGDTGHFGCNFWMLKNLKG